MNAVDDQYERKSAGMRPHRANSCSFGRFLTAIPKDPRSPSSCSLRTDYSGVYRWDYSGWLRFESKDTLYDKKNRCSSGSTRGVGCLVRPIRRSPSTSTRLRTRYNCLAEEAFKDVESMSAKGIGLRARTRTFYVASMQAGFSVMVDCNRAVQE